MRLSPFALLSVLSSNGPFLGSWEPLLVASEVFYLPCFYKVFTLSCWVWQDILGLSCTFPAQLLGQGDWELKTKTRIHVSGPTTNQLNGSLWGVGQIQCIVWVPPARVDNRLGRMCFLFSLSSFFFFFRIFKISLLNLLQYHFCFMFWYFGPLSMWHLCSPRGMEPTPPHWKAKS